MTFLSPVVRKAGTPQDPPILEGAKFDREKILPLALIRQHTKSDDVVRVPDTLLSLYRDAALSAAEQYTGMLFTEQKVITQDASSKRDLTAGHRWKGSFKLRLKYPTSDGILYLYGGKGTPEVHKIVTEPGAAEVVIPINHFALDMTPCCGDPCGRPANAGRMLMYRAGFVCETDIPPQIAMGCLKYIAWQIENPGDEASGRVDQSTSNPQAGRNNASWQSGAIEEWRIVVKDAY